MVSVTAARLSSSSGFINLNFMSSSVPSLTGKPTWSYEGCFRFYSGKVSTSLWDHCQYTPEYSEMNRRNVHLLWVSKAVCVCSNQRFSVVSQTLFVKYHQCLSYTGHYFCILWNVMCQITLHDLPDEVEPSSWYGECFSSRIQRQCVKAVLVNHNATKAHSFH